MSGLYPSLEDLSVDKEARAAVAAVHATNGSGMQRRPYHTPSTSSLNALSPAASSQASSQASSVPTSLYGGLLQDLGVDYLGIDTSPEAIIAHMPPEVQMDMQREVGMQVATLPPQQLATRRSDLPGSQAIMPLTPQTDRGLVAGTIRQGVREIHLAKDESGKLGIAVKAIDKGVFVSFVWSNSAGAMAGLRFGDQILQINGESVAGFNESKTLKILKNAPAEKVVLAVRDRPWCRSLTVRKDSLNHCGFTFRNGVINNIVKDSSAARNGLLVNHRLIEVNGQNVVGMNDKDMLEVVRNSPPSVTLTIMPAFIYEHLVKRIGSSLIKKYMDHSIPDI